MHKLKFNLVITLDRAPCILLYVLCICRNIFKLATTVIMHHSTLQKNISAVTIFYIHKHSANCQYFNLQESKKIGEKILPNFVCDLLNLAQKPFFILDPLN